jgi:hypothetical protein
MTYVGTECIEVNEINGCATLLAQFIDTNEF